MVAKAFPTKINYSQQLYLQYQGATEEQSAAVILISFSSHRDVMLLNICS